MKNINLYQASFTTVILRFYLMMAVVTIGVYAGLWWITFLGFPIFLTAMLGVAVEPTKKVEEMATSAKMVPLNMKKKKAV